MILKADVFGDGDVRLRPVNPAFGIDVHRVKQMVHSSAPSSDELRQLQLRVTKEPTCCTIPGLAKPANR
ncbi:hypothetical protein D3C71_1996320 [compost metagenome]